MSTINSISTRHATNYFGQQLIITIPSHKQWLQLPFLILWLMGWTFGELATINDITKHGLNNSSIILLMWIIIWTIGGVTALLSVFWIIFGHEIITVDEHKSLTHHRKILGFGQSKGYDLSLIQDLRAAPSTIPNSRQWPGWQNYNVITFEYDTQTIRIGNSLDDEEARQIIHTLCKYIQTLSHVNSKQSKS